MTRPPRTRLLIVDDDDGMIDSLVMALEDEFEIVTAANGQEGLAAMASHTVDVVLLDLMMPVLDGEGFMKEHARRQATTPVLLLSADMDLRARAAALGAADHLHKPFALTALETKLRHLARGSGAPGAASGGTGTPSSGGSGAGTPKPRRVTAGPTTLAFAR